MNRFSKTAYPVADTLFFEFHGGPQGVAEQVATAEAIARHGARQGARLALARLWRCRPFTQGGVDLVPDIVSDMAELSGNRAGNRAGNGERSEVQS